MNESSGTAEGTVGKKSVPEFVRKVDFSGEIVSILIAMIIICVFFSLTSPYFLTVRNILNFTMNSSILGIMAAGLFIAMVIGEIDVSQYSILALSTAVMVILIRRGTGSGLSIAIAIGIVLICSCGHQPSCQVHSHRFVNGQPNIVQIIISVFTGLSEEIVDNNFTAGTK